MGISKITAITIAINYPDNIMIAAGIDEGLKWAGFVYLLKDGAIDTLKLSTENVFDSEELAKLEMENICKELQDWYNQEFRNKEE